MNASLLLYEVHVFLPLGNKGISRPRDHRIVDRDAVGLHVDGHKRALSLQLVDLLKLLLLDHSLEHGEQPAREADVLQAVGFRNPARHSVHVAERINEAAKKASSLELGVVLALAEILAPKRIERVVKLELVDQRSLPLHIVRQGSRFDSLPTKPAKIVGRVTVDKRDVGLLRLRTQPSDHTLGINVAFSVPDRQIEVAA